MKQKVYIKWFLFTIIFSLSGVLFSQTDHGDEDSLDLFEKQAKKDALYEQSVQLLSAADELDFWTDQKNFEKALKKFNYNAYRTYLTGKRKAYLEHEEHCDKQCKHGDYYQLQASFYYQYGEWDISEVSLVEEEDVLIKENSVSINNKFR